MCVCVYVYVWETYYCVWVTEKKENYDDINDDQDDKHDDVLFSGQKKGAMGREINFGRDLMVLS